MLINVMDNVTIRHRDPQIYCSQVTFYMILGRLGKTILKDGHKIFSSLLEIQAVEVGQALCRDNEVIAKALSRSRGRFEIYT